MESLALDTEINGFTAKVEHDPHGADESPREWEGESVFFGFHRSYASPDPAPDSDPETARAMAYANGNICLPVWLYSHSGTCYRAAESNPFHCPWDSGLFGFIYITRADARKMYGVTRITEKQRLRLLADLAAQVETYSKWANGETYRWSIEDEDGDEIDGCGGYYDEDEAEAEALASLASYAHPESELAA